VGRPANPPGFPRESWQVYPRGPVAAKAQGADFLGESVEQGTSIWLALDEPLDDLVRRLVRYGARDHVVICQEPIDLAKLEALIAEVGAKVLVIDTLSEFARGLVDDYNSAAQWTPQLQGLRSVLQGTGAGGILLHHSAKATGRYRDSSAIGAGVDAILEMSTPPEDQVVRVIRARGRMVMSDFRLRFVDPLYHLEGTEMPLELRVYRVVESHPGVSQNRIREAVYGATKAIDRTLEDLCRRGAIEDRASGRGHAYYVKLAENGGRNGVEASLGGAKCIKSNRVEHQSRVRVEATSTPLLKRGESK
jgi:hypothetical protein